MTRRLDLPHEDDLLLAAGRALRARRLRIDWLLAPYDVEPGPLAERLCARIAGRALVDAHVAEGGR